MPLYKTSTIINSNYNRTRTDTGFVIAEFHDGLQVIPSVWLNADKQTCIWPSHMKTKLRINKAIIAREMPTENRHWETICIKRIFGITGKYNIVIYSCFIIYNYVIYI